MKRTLAMLLAVLMLFSLAPLTVLAATENDATITLTTNAAKNELEVGTAFTVTAAISGNDTKGFTALGITLNWNSEAVRFDGFATEYNEMLDANVLSDSIIASATVNNTVGSVQFAKSANVTKNGGLFTANFTVVGAGDADITIQREDVGGVGGFLIAYVPAGEVASVATEANIVETAVAGLKGVAAEPDYVLKTLTFEGEKWSDLIDEPQYGGTLLYGSGTGFDSAADAYQWTDNGNTELHSILSEGYGSWCYWSGGHAVSDYVSGEASTYGNYNSQLTVYKQGVTGLSRTGGGHNGSDNFAVHYGYSDNSGYSLSESALPVLSFSDGKARVIDSMWVNNTCYAANCYIDGNNLTAKIGENDWVKIVATGYNGTVKGNTAEFYLCNGPQNIVTDWTKWDLSSLGAVTRVTFNVTGSSANNAGFSQPAYFAFDDVAVRFEKHSHPLTAHQATQVSGDQDGNTAYWSCSRCGKYFSDAEGTAEIAENSWVIPAVVGIETKIKFRYGTGRLYAKADTEKTTDYLSGLTKSDNVYTVSVPEGDYVFEGYDGSLFLGSIELSVSEGHSDFAGAFGNHGEILAVTIANTDTTWVYGTDFTYEELSVVSGGQEASIARTVVMGENAAANCKTVLLHEGDTVTFKLVPQGAKAAAYAVVSGYKTCNAGFTYLSVTPMGKCTATVTYPYADTDEDGSNDFVLEFGVLKSGSYYVYDYFTPVTVSAPENGTVTATFNTAKGITYFYKVSNPLNADAVSYGNYGKTGNSAEGTTPFTVTEAQMYIGDSTKNRDTVIRDYSNNEQDSGDIYLASNAKGFTDRPGTGNQGVINLDTSENTSCTLYPYRNWLIIESISNAQVIEPDFHVQVINVEGNPITVTENTANDAKKHSFNIQANESGTAILLVTYDAVTADMAMGKNGKFFSAIRPENTGVLVVNVNKSGDVETNMFSPAEAVNTAMNEGGTAAVGTGARTAGKYYDAELDRLYFCTDAGASYSFTPEAGTTVTMAKGVQSGTVSFSAEGVSVKDGVVTLSGIPEGKSVVKLVNGEKVSYQVIRATRTNVVVKDCAGNVYYDSAAGTLNTDVKFAPGETITVTYSKLEHPAQKLSGIYNMNCTVVPYGEGIAVVKGGGNGVYTFNSTPANWSIQATVPATAAGSSYTLSALIRETGFGSFYGQHRELAYEIGKSPNFTAVQQNAWYAITSIDLPLTNSIGMTVKVVDQQGETFSGGTLTVTDVNGEALTATQGVYQVYPGKPYSYKLIADGKETVVSTVVIPAAAESYELSFTVTDKAASTWGGASAAVTPDKDGVYEITTGDELAWFAAEVNAGTGAAYRAKLMSDISLNSLSWTPIGTSSKPYTGTFDGNGHVISGVYINATTTNQGLFGYVNGAAIKNLGVSGSVKSTANNVGGIVGYGTGAYVIEGCFNAATVTGKQSVGGLVGYAMSAGTIRNSYNIGSITATSQYGGGISGCANTNAAVPVATNCYNVGLVNSTKNGGAINPGAAAKASNSYYLDTCYVTGVSAKAGTAKTAGELKTLASTMGEGFCKDINNINNGYPILTWQVVVEPVVIAPAVEGGKATAAVDAATEVEENIPIVLNTVSADPNVTEATLSIPAAVMENIAEARELEIQTNVGTIVFDKDALAQLGTAAVEISIAKTEKPENAEEPAGSNAQYIDLTAKAGENDVFTGSGGSAKVAVEYEAPAEADKTVYVYYVNGSERTRVPAEYVGGKLVITMSHFSVYQIVTETKDAEVMANDTDNVTLNAPTTGWKIGENTFTVSSLDNAPCVVMLKRAGEITVLTADNANGIHTYTCTLADGDELIVRLKGDLNGDGYVNVTDVGLAKSAYLGKTQINEAGLYSLTGGESLAITDAARLKAVYLGKISFVW